MKNIFSAVFIVFHLTSGTYAQSPYKFHSQNFAGILEGEAGTYFQLQSINGFQRGTWFGGLGTGLDYYYFRTIPLFLSVNKFFCPCERSFYVSLDGGINWIWDKTTAGPVNNYQEGNFSPSLYLAGGLGYRIGLKNKRDALLLNLGYSAKHMNEKIEKPNPCLFPPCPVYSERFKYSLNRLSLRVGWQF